MHRFNCFQLVLFSLILSTTSLLAQGVTTGGINGFVYSEEGEPLVGTNVVAVHVPSGTQYGAVVRTGGAFNILNMKVGGPYSITASFIGYQSQTEEDVRINLGFSFRITFTLPIEAIEMAEIEVVAERDEVLNSSRTGAATFINPDLVAQMPSIKRSTRDLTRLDPRSDGNFSFGGRNWLYNNISLDGSYFNNPFGLDDPAPGGQANAEPVPFDAVEQVQVSIAPFDVREGGFTGAGINIVTKSGTNQLKGSVYSYTRNESFVGNKVSGEEVIASPDLSFNQSGFTISGPIIENKLFFFVSGERERREDPASNFVADRGGDVEFGESRVSAATMDSIRQIMKDVYGYDTGEYENYFHSTENDKILLKIDWNINDNHNLTLRYNRLDAVRDLPPHPFAASFLGTGRGPNENTLPFQNSGYTINNELDSYALELNSVFGSKIANRFFFSYNKFRDFRKPVSVDFPTIEIGEDGITYTTVGHEPFSIHNILDQDVFQFTNNLSYFSGRHVYTVGVNYERFNFFNSFNLFRHGVFLAPADLGILTGGFLPFDFLDGIGATTFSSVDNFYTRTNPDSAVKFYDLNALVGSGPFVGENIEVGQLAFYVQDEFQMSEQIKLTYGLRVDRPIYFTEPVDNPFSRAMILLDENGDSETVDQSKLPDASLLFSPRVGFNWDVNADRSLQVRGGTGIFTGRLPFVWIGNNISNPGPNPNLFGFYGGLAEEDIPADHVTDDGSGRLYEGRSVLKQSFFLNAMVDDFKWPQVWTTDFAVDTKLPWDILGTFEFLYGKDLNAIYLRNGDLAAPVGNLPDPDGRPIYGGGILNPFVVLDGGDTLWSGDAYSGAYIIDNTSEGYNFNFTVQLRKNFDFGLNTSLSYTFSEAKSNLKSTEIAFELWQQTPVQGNPNKPELSFSEFGHRHRIVGAGNYSHSWSDRLTTHFGLFLELAEGNRFAGAGGNRYSFTYSGDINGDGSPSNNDLIYIPNDQSEINLVDFTNSAGNVVTAAEQWTALDAFIEQDNYLKEHRGEIAERFGAVNPWYSNIDLRILQDYALSLGETSHKIQLSIDILNVANLLNSNWGVRKVASVAATSPLRFNGYDANGNPELNFTGPAETYIDDPGLFSRWQIQVGLRYLF